MGSNIDALQKACTKTITSETLYSAFGYDSQNLIFDGLGDVHSSHCPNIISFVKSDKYLSMIEANTNITGVICDAKTAKKITSKRLNAIVVEDPNYAYFMLVDFLASSYLENISSQINSDFSSEVSIAEYGVYIGKNVKIEPNVVILPGVVINDNVLIRAGAVLGLDSFQHQRTSYGMISPRHDGLLLIEANVEIGANSTISKGFSYRSTFIGEGCKLDAQVYIAHGVKTGHGNIICAGARIMGHVMLGDDVFVGPNCVISSRLNIGDGAQVSLGSVVTTNVEANTKVSGNFAVVHDKWLSFVRSIR